MPAGRPMITASTVGSDQLQCARQAQGDLAHHRVVVDEGRSKIASRELAQEVQHCSASGRSSPRRWRSSATAAGSGETPPVDIRISAGSPGHDMQRQKDDQAIAQARTMEVARRCRNQRMRAPVSAERGLFEHTAGRCRERAG